MEAKDVPSEKPAGEKSAQDRPRGELLGFPMKGERNQNPPELSFLALLLEDLRTHESPFAHGFVAMAVHRFANWRMGLPKWLRPPFTVLFEILNVCVFWTARIEIPYVTKMGRRVRFWHHGGCVVGALYVGDDVQFRHNVTVGLAHHGAPLTTVPIIEDRVIVGAGACILGPITVGHDSVIAANAVVTIDVPPYSLVAGIPGKVIRKLEERERLTTVRIKEGVA